MSQQSRFMMVKQMLLINSKFQSKTVSSTQLLNQVWLNLLVQLMRLQLLIRLSLPLDVTINLISQQLLKILKTMTVLSLVIRPMKLFINTTLTISKLQLLKNQLKHVKITFQFHLSSTILRNLKDVSWLQVSSASYWKTKMEKSFKLYQMIKTATSSLNNSCSARLILVRHLLIL